MKKFECAGCGGSLIESGKFYICENCGTKYVLGKDDEGNPFTYIPIEKKEISHGVFAQRASHISVNTVSVREIKLSDNIAADVHKEALNIDTQDNIRVIETYLRAKEWDAAQNQINQLLLEDSTCAEAQWLGLMCERKVSNDRDLLKTFSNFTEADRIRLDNMLENSSPTFAKRVISLLFGGAYANDSMCCAILSVILPYAKNEIIYSEKEYSEIVNHSFEIITDNSFCNSFDYLISAALESDDVDKYIQYVERFADKATPQISKNYYAKIIEVDPANINAHRKLVRADIITDENIEKSMVDFEDLLKYSLEADKEIYSVISIIKSFDPTTSIKSALMWNVLGYYSSAPEGLKSEILEYANTLIHSSLWEQARNYLNLILSFDAQNADAYWGLCLVRLQAKSESSLSLKKDNLIDCPEFAKCLSLYQRAGNNKRAEELMTLTKKQKSAKTAKKIFLWVGIAIATIASVIAIISIINYSTKYADKNIIITVTEKGYTSNSSYSGDVSSAIEIEIKNNSSLGISNLSGTIKVYNDSDTLIGKSNVTLDEIIKSRGNDKFVICLEATGSDTAEELFYAELRDIKIEFLLKSVVFEGGVKKEYDTTKIINSIASESERQAQIEQDNNQKAYDEALSLLESGKYQEAYEAFSGLGDYNDSEKKMQDAAKKIEEVANNYKTAIGLYESGDYKKALDAFIALNGYQDSASYINKCKDCINEEEYSAAVSLFESGKYEEALKVFTSLNGCKDSKSRIIECENAITEVKYENAIELYNNAQYDQAIRLFKEIGDYKESNNYVSRATIICADIGDSFYWGKYEQDNDTSNGKEAIEWVVLDKQNGELLVISKYILDGIQYSKADNYSDVSWSDISWENSFAREWLNTEFIDNAFDDNEIELIITTSVEPDEDIAESVTLSKGNSTDDKIFLLGLSEYNNYCRSKDIAKEIRTKYSNAFDVHCVWIRYRNWAEWGRAGNVMLGMVSYKLANEYSGVRPAMWIKIPE